MADEILSPVWLEQVDGGRVEIQGTCSLGRAPSNQFVLRDEKVSRRHAIVHAQGQNEFWLVDLGSSNGTYVNGRRVAQPIQLRDRERWRAAFFGRRIHYRSCVVHPLAVA